MTMMRGVRITAPGGPDVLAMAEVERPSPAATDVLVAVRAAGVNRPDLLQREGRYPVPAGASELPGLELAGRVIEVGAKVERWKVGDEVCALVAGGGYAELCAVPEAQCLPVPPGYSMVQAAALPETFFTVWTNLFDGGRLVAGESVLVHGGASGIGTTAIQVARAFGARVYVTAGTDAKCRACERLGALRAINYRTERFADVVMQVTSGRGVDVCLDMVAGDYTPLNLSCLAPRGRLVQIAVLRGAVASVNLMQVMQKRLVITGSTLRPRSVEEKGRIRDALEAHVWPKLADGSMAPVIDSVFPLARAADAHRRLEAGEHVGKVVLEV
ncbi:MAG: NAD(P)H-quinone oxidoreductase [Vicinamibacterales bacterium]